jgi:uncharacterized protein HemX
MSTKKETQISTPETKKSSTAKTVVIVSLIWIIIGAVVFAFMQNSQAQYNRGIFDGMEKTKAILQAK